MSTAAQDIELLSQLKQGDKAGFDMLFRKYYKPLCSHAFQFVSFEDVEEIAQDVLLWVGPKRYSI